MSEEVEPKIVEGVFTSANTGGLAHGAAKSPLAKMIEAAMAQAVQDCYSNGVTDPEQVREYMQKARTAVKEWYAAKLVEFEGNLAR